MNCPRYEKVIEDRDCLLRYIGAKRNGGPICPSCIRGQLLHAQKQEKAEKKQEYTQPEDLLARAIDNLEDGRGLKTIPTDKLAEEYNRLAVPDGHRMKKSQGMAVWLRRLGLSVSLWGQGGGGITTHLFMNRKAQAFITKKAGRVTEILTHIYVVTHMAALLFGAIVEGLFYTLAGLAIGTLALLAVIALIFRTFRRSE